MDRGYQCVTARDGWSEFKESEVLGSYEGERKKDGKGRRGKEGGRFTNHSSPGVNKLWPKGGTSPSSVSVSQVLAHLVTCPCFHVCCGSFQLGE